MQSAWRGIALFLGCFAGLCTLFAGVAAAYDAWGEHVRAGWPAATARVERCAIREYQGRRGKSYYIRCSLAYTVAAQTVEARVDSRMVPDPARVISRSPGLPDLGDLQEWVAAHPAGTPIDLHYDPASPQTAALAAKDMPLAGPKSPNDLRLVCAFGIPCVVLLLIGRIRRRTR